VHVPRLLRDLARDLVGAHGVLWRRLLEAQVAAHKHERHRHAKPQEAEREQRAKRHRAAALLAPDEQVEAEERGKHDAREQQRGAQRHRAPLVAAEGLVQARRGVARHEAHEHKHEHHRGHQAAAVGRRQEAEQRKERGDEQHAKDLHAHAHVGRQQRGGRRRAEHVAVDLSRVFARVRACWCAQRECVWHTLP
jgi:hypothetical protein